MCPLPHHGYATLKERDYEHMRDIFQNGRDPTDAVMVGSKI
ncbi:MAG TPA: hypothetical protein VGR50_07685 [Terriglobales bacterium]|nr:hypothetical protein [Terriglobales bacterium]